MKRELFLQIAEIESKNDASKVLDNIATALHNNEINSDEFNHIMHDFDLTLKSLGIFK